MDSTKIYQRIEERHTFVTTVLYRTLLIMITITFGTSFMFPISYTIFHYPEPKQWRLFVEIQ